MTGGIEPWGQHGVGGMQYSDLGTAGKNTVLLEAYTGTRTLAPGKAMVLSFDLVVTPAKALNVAAHWGNR